MITVTREDIGRKVIYHTNYGTDEEGEIVALGPLLVFVRFGTDKHTKATNPRDLEWVSSKK